MRTADVVPGMSLHHLGGPVAVVAVEGPEARVAGPRGLFWTWVSCLWRSP